MNGFYLRFYAHEDRKVHGVLFYEWLLAEAKKIGIPGGSAFKAMAGYGRHGVMHETKFFELAGDVAVEIEFIVSAADADRLVALVRASGVPVFYGKVPAEFGVIGD
jgi:PII-like signaling protein